MAQVKMEDFLLQYFMQLRFNNMPAEVRAQFDAYAKNDDFRGNMKHWKSHLMHEDADGKLVQNDVPNAHTGDYTLSAEELEKLFKEFQKAFRALNAQRKNYKNTVNFDINNDKLIEFVDEYFGAGKLFEEAVATPEAEAQIKELANMLPASKSAFEVKLSEWNIELSYTDLLNGLQNKKYNTDADFQKKLARLAGYLNYYKEELAGPMPGLKNINLQAIETGFDDATVPPHKMAAFRDEYDLLLRKIFREKKIRENFPSDKIVNAYNDAKKLVDYDNKDAPEYIPPKRDDELTPMQQLSKWAGDTYEDTLAKYLEFKGDRMYFSPQAKQIVGAIHSEKIKPTDGIKVVLEKADQIKKRLMFKSPQATEHFDWFVKALGELQNTMPKAFEGALRNGRQMRALVEEMIIMAVRDGKEKEAKTAMEVLSVIKYGYTTSSIMDKLRKEDLTIFSDGKLSWNKNEGMQFVTKALDKSIRAAFLGVGYGITMVANAINLSGSKFRGKSSRISKDHKTWEEQSLIQRQDLEEQQNADRQLRNENHRTLRELGRAGIDETTIDSLRSDLTKERTRQSQYQQMLDNARQKENLLADSIKDIDTHLIPDAQVELARATAEVTRINNRIAWLNAEIANPATPPAMVTTYQNELNDLQTNQLPAAQQSQTAANDKIADLQRERRRLDTSRLNMPAVIARLEKSVADQDKANSKQEIKLNSWTDARQTIDFLNARITKRNDAISKFDDNHKDKYRELMAYWDMLETGRDSHMGKMYNWLPRTAKGAQKSFDTKKDAIIQDAISNYKYKD